MRTGLGVIKHCWLESGGVRGYRKITRDLRDLGGLCGKHRIARLMRHEGLRAQVDYGRQPCYLQHPPTARTQRRLLSVYKSRGDSDRQVDPMYPYV